MVIYCKLSLISPSAYKTPSFQTHLINCKHPVISPLLYPQIYYNVLNAQGLKAVVYGIGVKLTEKNKANYRLYSSETYNESIRIHDWSDHNFELNLSIQMLLHYGQFPMY